MTQLYLFNSNDSMISSPLSGYKRTTLDTILLLQIDAGYWHLLTDDSMPVNVIKPCIVSALAGRMLTLMHIYPGHRRHQRTINRYLLLVTLHYILIDVQHSD